MSGWIIFLAGLIFIFIILIIIVYLVYYNRTTVPSAEITNFGFTLSTQDQRFLTVETLFIPFGGPTPVPAMTLQKIAFGQYATAAEGWNLFDVEKQAIIPFLGTQPGGTGATGPAPTPSNTKVALVNNLTNGFADGVVYQGVPPLTIFAAKDDDPPVDGDANVFILEYDMTKPKVIKLKSATLPQINGQDQYMIPGPVLGVPPGNTATTIVFGVPTDNNNEWIVNFGQ